MLSLIHGNSLGKPALKERERMTTDFCIAAVFRGFHEQKIININH